MNREQLVDLITQEVWRALEESHLLSDAAAGGEAAPRGMGHTGGEGAGKQGDTQGEILTDISSPEYKASIRLNDSENAKALEVMRKHTPARIGIGKAGPRVTTKTMLALRADHAGAKDAVMKQADGSILDKLGLFQIQSQCGDIHQHLTRPDMGRRLSDEAKAEIRDRCSKNPQVQIYVSDGLSSTAVDENISDILPVLVEGLKDKGIHVGTPFFLRYGRVGAMDQISELLSPDVTCVLLGERPGLAAADSMSAYIAYRARMGMPESRRTVISNIHKNGIQPVEAGAYIVDVIQAMLREKKSGVDLKL